MGEVLVDTDVFSYLFKGDTRAALYWPHVAGKVLHLSFATVAELYRWTLHANWGQPRIDDLNDALRSYTIVPYDDDGVGVGSCHDDQRSPYCTG